MLFQSLSAKKAGGLRIDDTGEQKEMEKEGEWDGEGVEGRGRGGGKGKGEKGREGIGRRAQLNYMTNIDYTLQFRSPTSRLQRAKLLVHGYILSGYITDATHQQP